MSAWDGTAESYADAFGRLSAGRGTQTDVALIQEVLSIALTATELRARIARLEAMVVATGRLAENETKRRTNEVAALEAEVKRLAEKLAK